MEKVLEDAIKQVLYYYNEYEQGNEEGLIALKEIARIMNTQSRNNKKNYYIFKILITLLNCRIFVFAPQIMGEDNYQNLINYAKNDIEYYMNVSKKLKSFCIQCLKTGNYQHLDSAYILSLKLSEILSNISEYFEEVTEIQKYAANCLYYSYPYKVELDRRKINDEIELLVLKMEGKK